MWKGESHVCLAIPVFAQEQPQPTLSQESFLSKEGQQYAFMEGKVEKIPEPTLPTVIVL